MDISQMKAIERVARVLAAIELNRNAAGGSSSVAIEVDHAWPSHLDAALAVLNALRAPDTDMAAVGDVEIWERMVRSAIGEDVPPVPPASRSWTGEHDIYQKPLG